MAEKTFIYEKNNLVSIFGSIAFTLGLFLLIFGLYDLFYGLGSTKLIISGTCFLLAIIAFKDDRCYKLEKKGKYIYYTNLYEREEGREDREEYAFSVPWLNKQITANPEEKDKLLEETLGTSLKERTLVLDLTDEDASVTGDRYHFHDCVFFEGMRDGVEGEYIDCSLMFKASHRDCRTGRTLIEFLEEA